MLIEIKHKLSGNVLFSHDVMQNTIAFTLAAALSCGADLYGADLRGANLRGADLHGADLYGANLHGADLYGADLYGANLHGADLYGADLHGADLHGADLHGADLHGADLHGADLYGANLHGADLHGADLYGADLYGANLKDAKNSELVIAQTRILPEEGDIIGFKKCNNSVIVKLLIPANAKRSHAFGRKCRAEFAKVLEISDGSNQAIGSYDNKTEYNLGEIVHCREWNDDFTIECTGGIHFFITRIEAENY